MLKSDTAQIRRVAFSLRRDGQLVEKVDKAFEANQRLRTEIYGLRAEVSTCNSQKDDLRKAGQKSWDMYVSEQTDNKLLRKKLTGSRVKGIAWAIVALAVGATVGRVL